MSSEPLLDLAQIEQGIAQVLSVTTQTDPRLLTATYEALRRSEGDSGCPYYYYTIEDYGYDYWYAGCTASGGASFTGYAYSYVYAPYAYVSGVYAYQDLGYVGMFGAITDRLGESLEVSGTFYHQNYAYNGGMTHYGSAYLRGDARWNADAAAGTWLAAEYSMSLDYSYAHNYSTEGGFYLGLDGSLSGVSGAVNSALFDGVFFQNTAAGSACALEPSGTISVRDGEGEWYHTTFDGPPYAGAPVFPPECDGCGDVFYRGEALGQVCPDFSSIMTWSGTPWK